MGTKSGPDLSGRNSRLADDSFLLRGTIRVSGAAIAPVFFSKASSRTDEVVAASSAQTRSAPRVGESFRWQTNRGALGLGHECFVAEALAAIVSCLEAKAIAVRCLGERAIVARGWPC